MGRFCGSSLPPVQFSETSEMLVEFVSDATTSGGGFTAAFKAGMNSNQSFFQTIRRVKFLKVCLFSIVPLDTAGNRDLEDIKGSIILDWKTSGNDNDIEIWQSEFQTIPGKLYKQPATTQAPTPKPTKAKEPKKGLKIPKKKPGKKAKPTKKP